MSTVTTAEFGTVRSYPSLTQIFKQDEAAEDVYLLHEGLIKLVWNDEEGSETIVGLRWAGHFLAAPACIAKAANPATAVTLEPVLLERISRERFLNLLRTNTAFAMRVHDANSREILEQTNNLGALACVPARERLERLLQYLTQELPDQLCLPDGRVRLPVKHKDLAALLAIRPEYLSRTLHKMAAAGTLTLKGEWIILHPRPLRLP